MVIITSFRTPESPLKLTERSVRAILDKRVLGEGTLFVSERTLSWQKEGDNGFSLEYFNISLHAVSKDPTVHDKECIYILTDPHITLPDNDGGTDTIRNEDDSDAESEPDLSELILVPEEPAHVSSIYESIKQCQELNPDPADVDDDDEDNEENLYADAEESEMCIEEPESEVNNLAERLRHNSVNIQYNYNNGNAEEEFEDAD